VPHWGCGSVRLNVRSENSRSIPFYAYGADAHMNLRRFRSILKDLADLLQVIQSQLTLSIYDDLRSIGLLSPSART